MKPHPKHRVKGKQPLASRMAGVQPDPEEPGEDPKEEAGESPAVEKDEDDEMGAGAPANAAGGFFRRAARKKR